MRDRSSRRSTARIASIVCPCCAGSPCEKFKRKTFVPDNISERMISRSADAGPIVATIYGANRLYRLPMLRGIAVRKIQTEDIRARQYKRADDLAIRGCGTDRRDDLRRESPLSFAHVARDRRAKNSNGRHSCPTI